MHIDLRKKLFGHFWMFLSGRHMVFGRSVHLSSSLPAFVIFTLTISCESTSQHTYFISSQEKIKVRDEGSITTIQKILNSFCGNLSPTWSKNFTNTIFFLLYLSGLDGTYSIWVQHLPISRTAKPLGWGLRWEGSKLDNGREDPEDLLYVIELEPNDSVDEEFEFEFWLPTKEDCVAVIFLDHGLEGGWISSCVWVVAWIGIDEKGSFSLRRISSFLTIWSARNGYPDFFKTSRNLR